METVVDELTYREAVLWGAGELAGHVESPRVDAESLLAHLLAGSRAAMYVHSGRRLDSNQLYRFRSLVARRRSGEPLQYLTGSQSFRGLELTVGPGVLVPRPETEMVVERALGLIRSVQRPRILELGTGSGAIALALATERPDARVWATEISPDALGWARLNLDRIKSGLGTGGGSQDSRGSKPRTIGRVSFLQGDLFEPLPENLKESFDLVIANPPYLSTAEFESAPTDVRVHEPRIATLSGPAGIEVTQRVIAGAAAWLRAGAPLVLEIAPDRAGQMSRLLARDYDLVRIHRDLAGRKRVAEGRRRGGR